MSFRRPVIAALALVPSSLWAQEDFESFRIEVTGSAWLIDTSGTIQSGILPIDLQRDLAIEQPQPHFFGKLIVQPARRIKFMVEGVPYRLNGQVNVTGQFTFAGHPYNVQDVVTSNATIEYIAGAYQFDLVSRPRGHFGLLVGLAYFNAAGTLTARNSGFTGSEQQSFPFPELGGEGRIFLLPHRNLLELDGELKGMSLTGHGHFYQAAIHGGVSVGRHITLQGGYMVANPDVHSQDETRAFRPTFQGPVFGIQVRDR